MRSITRLIGFTGRALLSACLATVLCVSLTACERNLAAGYDNADPDAEAMKALERGDPDKAISILKDAYAGNKDSNRYKSLMAMALMQKHGIDVIEIGLRMSESNDEEAGEGESESAETNEFIRLFGVMPDATQAALDGIGEAIELLLAMTLNPMPTSDSLKLMVAEISWFTLRLKILDTDGDGELSFAEVMADPDAAAEILGMLAAAVADAAGVDDDEDDKSDDLAAASAAKLSAIHTGISEGDGSESANLATFLGITQPTP